LIYLCQVNVLRFIFFCYTAMLSWWPCADIHAETGEGHVHAMESLNHTHSDAHDLCSPFCACGCCGMVIALHHGLGPACNPVDFPLSPDKDIINPTFFIPSSFLGKIWQPPQLTA